MWHARLAHLPSAELLRIAAAACEQSSGIASLANRAMTTHHPTPAWADSAVMQDPDISRLILQHLAPEDVLRAAAVRRLWSGTARSLLGPESLRVVVSGLTSDCKVMNGEYAMLANYEGRPVFCKVRGDGTSHPQIADFADDSVPALASR